MGLTIATQSHRLPFGAVRGGLHKASAPTRNRTRKGKAELALRGFVFCLLWLVD